MTLVADGHAAVNLVLLVVEEEPDDAIGGPDGDVVHVEINSPHRAGEHLQNYQNCGFMLNWGEPTCKLKQTIFICSQAFWYVLVHGT